ncbi:MAG: YbaB/EbfC family nucleoid-associated protein [Promethearchaeota archaeon]|jgi:DNA-binding protein YbaB
MDQNYFSEIKEKVTRQIEEIKNREYTGDAGAGMVKVTIRADLQVTKVEIDHTMFAKTAPEMIKDLDFLADLFKSAINQAIEKSGKDLTESYGIPSVQF